VADVRGALVIFFVEFLTARRSDILSVKLRVVLSLALRTRLVVAD
jgi:hypothetical protein